MKQQYRTLKITCEKEKRDLFRITKAELERREKQQISDARALELICVSYLMEVLGYIPEMTEE